MTTSTQRDEAVAGAGRKAAFTLIELLVAMTVLVIIVMVVMQIFRRASTAWDTGMDKTEGDLMGRAVVDYLVRDMASAIVDTNASPSHTFTASGTGIDFWSLGAASAGTDAVTRVTYSFGGTITRNGIVMIEGLSSLTVASGPSVPGEPPRYVDVTATVTNAAGVTNSYEARAYFPNRNRYKL